MQADERRPRDRAEQLVVLAAGDHQLVRVPPGGIGDLRDPLPPRHPVHLDLDPQPGRGGEMLGLRSEPVGDVDHRADPGRRQGAAGGQPRLGFELAGRHRGADPLRQSLAELRMLEQHQPRGRAAEVPR